MRQCAGKYVTAHSLQDFFLAYRLRKLRPFTKNRRWNEYVRRQINFSMPCA